MNNDGVDNNNLNINNDVPILTPIDGNDTVQNTTNYIDTIISIPSGVEAQNNNIQSIPQNTNTFTDLPVIDTNIPSTNNVENNVLDMVDNSKEEKKGLFKKKDKKEKKDKQNKKNKKGNLDELDNNNSSDISNNNVLVENTKPKKSFHFPFFWLLLIALLGGYLYYTNYVYKRNIDELKYRCSPVSVSKQEVALDINSSLVQSLYKKVATNIREDYAQPDWDNDMRLYLAYRQIPDYLKYESNCNMFDVSSMKPYTCDDKNFTPLAFSKDDLILQWKELFGEETEIVLDNIKLRNSCIGGYQYIPEREEFVQGLCESISAMSFKVDKKLVEAVTTRNTIILTEEVKYHGNEQMSLPSYLVSGTYYYTFRLDMNYNYVLVSKVFNDKY